jgi:hypothetical protein
MGLQLPTKLLLIASLALVATAASGTAVTYDFSGVVDSESGSFVPIIPGRSLVNGSFTIDFGAADISHGNTDSPSWTRAARGGSVFGTPPPAGLVFSSSMSVAGFNYASGPVSPILTSSLVEGTNGIFSSAVVIQPGTSGTTWTDFSLTLESSSPFLAAYLSNGLPNLGLIDLTNKTSSVMFTSGTGAPSNDFGFYLTSLTAASPVPPGGTPVSIVPSTPLPAALWLFGSGLALLGFSRKFN